MPNDPLSLPNHAQSRAAADDQATTELGRAFLTEYTSPQTETQRLLATIDRLRSVTLEQPSSAARATSAPALAAVALAIQQIETMLAANANSTPDVYFAVERIQDIAMALRQRELDAALCDSLDAAIREIGDATIRHEATAARAASAAALLGELRQRVDEMTTRSAAASGSPVSDHDLAAPADERPHDTAVDSTATGATNLLNENIGVLPEPLPPHRTLPETQPELAAPEILADPFEQMLLPVPSPIEGLFEAPQAAETGPPASQYPEADPIPRAPAEDPLAAVLHTLSEEELIALFS